MSDTTSPTIDRNVVDRFLAEDRIAFIGAHRDSKQFANSVYRHLRAGGRTLLPVHPDAALVMVKPDAARAVVDECIARGS
jgi:predicted CoA-binding protein